MTRENYNKILENVLESFNKNENHKVKLSFGNRGGHLKYLMINETMDKICPSHLTANQAIDVVNSLDQYLNEIEKNWVLIKKHYGNKED